MIVSYNGKNYYGFQRQKNGNTIQNELETAINKITHKNIEVVGSGRTDAGVSAYAQPVHFDIDKAIDTNKFLRSLNGILPKDIQILSITPTEIHARHSAKRKTYLYKMYVSNISLPLYTDALQISPTLDFKQMYKFLKLITGTHDFKGFQSSNSPTATTVRTIYKASFKKAGLYLNFQITGNGFLYKMVRNIVGTMLKIGEGKIKLEDIKPNLFTSFKSVNTAPAPYLYLLNVEYPKN